jgi:hypothetical protein
LTSANTPRFAGSSTPGIKARPFVDAPSQKPKALNDAGVLGFRCWLASWLTSHLSVQAAAQPTGEHASAKVHPVVLVPAAAFDTSLAAVNDPARFQPLSSAASRFDAVVP